MKYTQLYKVILMMGMMVLTHSVFAQEAQAPVQTQTQAQPSTTMTAEQQAAMSPQQALQRLKDGNQRFVSGTMQSRNLLDQAKTTATGQHPFAVVLGCIDSRTPPEMIFDQGIGDIFVARVAGNIQNSDILGSMEFGTKLEGAKLIAVIGHTSCGAVRGACNQAKLGNLSGLLRKIQPAVDQASKERKTHDCSDHAFIDQIARDNVMQVMKQIQIQSPVIAQLIKDGKIGLVGGMQDLATGKVTFFDNQNVMPK